MAVAIIAYFATVATRGLFGWGVFGRFSLLHFDLAPFGSHFSRDLALPNPPRPKHPPDKTRQYPRINSRKEGLNSVLKARSRTIAIPIEQRSNLVPPPDAQTNDWAAVPGGLLG